MHLYAVDVSSPGALAPSSWRRVWQAVRRPAFLGDLAPPYVPQFRWERRPCRGGWCPTISADSQKRPPGQRIASSAPRAEGEAGRDQHPGTGAGVQGPADPVELVLGAQPVVLTTACTPRWMRSTLASVVGSRELDGDIGTGQIAEPAHRGRTCQPTRRRRRPSLAWQTVLPIRPAALITATVMLMPLSVAPDRGHHQASMYITRPAGLVMCPGRVVNVVIPVAAEGRSGDGGFELGRVSEGPHDTDSGVAAADRRRPPGRRRG